MCECDWLGKVKNIDFLKALTLFKGQADLASLQNPVLN